MLERIREQENRRREWAWRGYPFPFVLFAPEFQGFVQDSFLMPELASLVISSVINLTRCLMRRSVVS